MESRNGWPQPLIPVMLSPTGWVAPMVSRTYGLPHTSKR
jgi:hypothetical protein